MNKILNPTLMALAIFMALFSLSFSCDNIGIISLIQSDYEWIARPDAKRAKILNSDIWLNAKCNSLSV